MRVEIGALETIGGLLTAESGKIRFRE